MPVVVTQTDITDKLAASQFFIQNNFKKLIATF